VISFFLFFLFGYVLYVFRVVHLRACVSPSDSCIPYSFLSFCQVHLWYDLKMAGLRSWLLPVGHRVGLGPRTSMRYSSLMAASSHGGIYLQLKLTIHSACDTLIHLEELLQLGGLLCPSMHRYCIFKSSSTWSAGREPQPLPPR
jgi:hypothetical protein